MVFTTDERPRTADAMEGVTDQVEAARRCLEARAGRSLDEQLALTRLARKYLVGAAEHITAPTPTPAWRQRRA
jgi:hypothetical protein